MFVTIRWHGRVAGSPADVARGGRELAAVLGQAPGFVSFALLETGDGAFASICVFESRAALERADRLHDRWTAEREARTPLPAGRLTRGEIVAQKGI
jgi:hypothetical protein